LRIMTQSSVKLLHSVPDMIWPTMLKLIIRPEIQILYQLEPIRGNADRTTIPSMFKKLTQNQEGFSRSASGYV